MRHLVFLALSAVSLVEYAAPAPADMPMPRAVGKKQQDAGFAPPDVLEAKAGFAIYVPPASVKAVFYLGLDGEEAFPVHLVGGSPTAFVFMTRGLPVKNYRFVGIASDAAGNLTRKDFVVPVGKPPATPAPPTSPAPPVVTPPAPVPATYYFLVVRQDGPTAPALEKVMKDPAWEVLRKAGHKVSAATASQAQSLRVPIPGDHALPVVVTLVEGETASTVVRPAIPLPTTGAAIEALPKLK